jgi:hypothetical protein
MQHEVNAVLAEGATLDRLVGQLAEIAAGHQRYPILLHQLRRVTGRGSSCASYSYPLLRG